MCIIDEKQEAITRIRMAIDNNKKACLDLKSTEDIIESEVKVDPELKSSKSSVHKCRNLAVLDRTFDGIYKGFEYIKNGPETSLITRSPKCIQNQLRTEESDSLSGNSDSPSAVNNSSLPLKTWIVWGYLAFTPSLPKNLVRHCLKCHEFSNEISDCPRYVPSL